MSVGRSNSLPPSRPRCPFVPSVITSLPSERELVDHVQLIVEHPDMFLGVVRVHFDLVRPAPALHLEQLVVLGPRLHHLAVAIDHEDHVVVSPLPPALLLCRFARRAEPIVVSGGTAPRGIEQRVRRPRLGAGGQRELAPLCNPDPVWRLGVHGADGSPGPALVLDAVGLIGQRLRPVLNQLVGTKLFLASFFLHRRCHCGGQDRHP